MPERQFRMTAQLPIFGSKQEDNDRFENFKKTIYAGTEPLTADSAPLAVTLSHDSPYMITKIAVPYSKYSGIVRTEFLPLNLTQLDLSFNNFSGTLDLTCLPLSLRLCNLSQNSFRGSIDFSLLPAQLAELNVSFNSFSGVVSLGALPARLTKLYVNNNQFSFIRGAEQSLEEDFRWPEHLSVLQLNISQNPWKKLIPEEKPKNLTLWR